MASQGDVSPSRSFAAITKSDAEINKLKLEECKAYARTITKSMQSFYQHLFDPTTGVITKLQQQLEMSQAINQSLLRQLSEVERTAISNAQYARRETLELHGVPDSFGDAADGLESKIIDLLNDIAPDADIVPSDVHAVHRLSRKKNHVIIKLISRKKKQQLIVKRAKLKEDAIKRRHGIDNGIYLNESMCPQIGKLHFHCRKLKKNGKIHYYTFFNGNLRVQMQEDDQKHTVGHISDLERLTGMSKDDIENMA